MSTHTLIVDQAVLDKVPDLYMMSVEVTGITVTRTPQSVIEPKKAFLLEWKGKTVDDIKNLDTFKTYRKIHEQIGVYPENSPPAVENLYTRGILQGKFPTINSVVDSCYLVSVKSQLPIGVFDSDRIKGDIILRLAKEGDQFIPIGKNKPADIQEGIPILEDQERIISIPGVRDSNETKITKHTKNLLLFSWGNKDIPVKSLKRVLNEASHLIKPS